MSRFIDKLNRLSQAGSQPIGFRTAQPASSKPKIQLAASLAQESVESLVDRMAGADAGLLRISKLSSGVKYLQHISRAVPDIPWGGWLQGSSQGGVKQMTKAGYDFIVFPATSTPLAILQNDKVGKILEVEASLNEGLLRTIDELPVDAVLIASQQEGDYFLTWHHLMLFHYFADSLTKPLLAQVSSRVTANELQALWEAGVKGVVIEAGDGQSVGALATLRQAIDKLTFAPHRQRGKTAVLLPHINSETDIITEEE